LARCVPDRRDPTRIAHTIADMIRARVFAICCGYEGQRPRSCAKWPFRIILGDQR
jgi:hypothetical protein